MRPLELDDEDSIEEGRGTAPIPSQRQSQQARKSFRHISALLDDLPWIALTQKKKVEDKHSGVEDAGPGGQASKT